MHEFGHDIGINLTDDFYDALLLIDTLKRLDKSVNTERYALFTLALSAIGTVLNLITLVVSVLMMKSLVREAKRKAACKKRRIHGKSRLMEYYLIEIIIFDLIVTLYLLLDSAFVLYNQNETLRRTQHLEDLSNFCCKTFNYIHKICLLMSCWLIVCFAMNRICLLLSGRYTFLPLVIYNQDDEMVNVASINQRRLTNSSLLSIQNQTGPCRNFKFVINSKKSTVILFLIFAIINIYLVEITGLVNVSSHMNSTLLHASYDDNFTYQHCGSTSVENKSVLALNITIFHFCGFFFPYLLTVLSLYYLIKNLYKLKIRINHIISYEKTKPLLIRSNELIFYRTALTSIFLCIFYILTTLPYNLFNMLALLKNTNPGLVIALSYVEYIKYLNHSCKFILIYFSNFKFQNKTKQLFRICTKKDKEKNAILKEFQIEQSLDVASSIELNSTIVHVRNADIKTNVDDHHGSKIPDDICDENRRNQILSKTN